MKIRFAVSSLTDFGSRKIPENLRNMNHICGGDYADKLHLLGEYAGRQDDIPDPWYTRDFASTWQAVEAGCQGLLKQLRNKTDGEEQAKSLYRH